jgi:putative flippase GtrA
VRAWARSPRGRTRIRYLAVTVVTVLVSQTVLALGFGILRWSAPRANLVSFVAGGLVSYQLNRRWTWQRQKRSSLTREVLPFWGIAFAGLALSTLAVAAAESLAKQVTSERALQTAFVSAASLAAFGTLWILKFVLFDRLLFASPPLLGDETSQSQAGDVVHDHLAAEAHRRPHR